MPKKIGQGPPPPYLDKIQKNSSYPRDIFPKSETINSEKIALQGLSAVIIQCVQLGICI